MPMQNTPHAICVSLLLKNRYVILIRAGRCRASLDIGFAPAKAWVHSDVGLVVDERALKCIVRGKSGYVQDLG
jgi:hypothetical protein